MIKVSVVIATYATTQENLDRLIGSLDNQTMPADEFEVIFVDDGSPDDTVDRLRRLQETRKNVKIKKIRNSGWPSKPRNVGTDMARGAYVTFMDHDDELYPDGLRAAYEFAAANHSDVLSAKEARTTASDWGMDTYLRDEGQSIGREDLHPLIPLNPHKLYRRDFLKRHRIRFPEGRQVLWEDQFFNFQVARHAEVVSTLSSVPFYHWVTTEGSGSTLFLRGEPNYWEWLRRVLEETATELAGPRFDLQRTQLMAHQYSTRVLGVFDMGYTKRPERERKLIFDAARELQERFKLSEFDDRLGASRRIRAYCLRQGRPDMLERVCVEDPAIAGWGRATSIEWRGGILHVSADVAWSNAEGRRHLLVREGDRILKHFTPEVNAFVPVEVRDMTDEIASADLEFAVHSRASRIAWLTPSQGIVRVEDAPDGSVHVHGELTATVDPTTAVFGRPLDPTSTHWDLNLRARLDKSLTQRALKSDVPASVTITDGRLHLVYPNDGGSATMIPDGSVEAVRRLAPMSAMRDENGDLVIALGGSHDGEGAVQTTVGIDVSPALNSVKFQETAAAFEVRDGQARLRLRPMGDLVRLRVGDRAPHGPKFWTLSIEKARVTLRAGQLPKIRTAAEIARADHESS